MCDCPHTAAAQVTYLGSYFMARSINAKVRATIEPGPVHVLRICRSLTLGLGAATQMFVNNVACANETVPTYGIEITGSPATGGSVFIGYDFDVVCGPVTNTPPSAETGTDARIGRTALQPTKRRPDLIWAGCPPRHARSPAARCAQSGHGRAIPGHGRRGRPLQRQRMLCSLIFRSIGALQIHKRAQSLVYCLLNCLPPLKRPRFVGPLRGCLFFKFCFVKAIRSLPKNVPKRLSTGGT